MKKGKIILGLAVILLLLLISIGFVLTKTSQKYDLSLKQSAKYYASKLFPEKFKTDGIPYYKKLTPFTA